MSGMRSEDAGWYQRHGDFFATGGALTRSGPKGLFTIEGVVVV